MSHDSPPVRRIDDPGLGPAVQDVLRGGGCLVIPTDTVYGIAARADDPAAVARLQQAKGRHEAFPPPVLVGDAADAWLLVAPPSPAARRLAQVFWPGPLTLILPVGPHPVSLSAITGTVGLRVPDHDATRALLRWTGPLAVSSANRHQGPPATTVDQALAQLGRAVQLYIDAGPTPGPAPSTVVDATGDDLVIRRPGLLGAEAIGAAGAGHA
jgi:tRNA threonylcarbamoyl adenosine modification protein (Sua5/YciO/YrdC/YwlC family)